MILTVLEAVGLMLAWFLLALLVAIPIGLALRMWGDDE